MGEEGVLVSERVEAVFESGGRAEEAITALRQMGVTDDQVSVVTRQGEDPEVCGEGFLAERTSGSAERSAGVGALAGAGVGTLFGLAAAIAGVGPFVTAGWLASILGNAGSAAAAGAIVGATTGAAASLFARAGYDEAAARYYGSVVERGGVFLAVDTTNSLVSPDQVRSALRHCGGRAQPAMSPAA